jgi:hypothetical protein
LLVKNIEVYESNVLCEKSVSWWQGHLHSPCGDPGTD